MEIRKGITGAGNYPADYTYKPTDGKTWFGKVYGGGSGFLPYVKGTDTPTLDDDECVWNRESGKVYGNSTVTITGGHILSNVYGGCETADVGMYIYNNEIHGDEWRSGGDATITMSGGTVGVPRTNAQITAHPIPGYVYGSGKGDPRLYFNTWTNVHTSNVTMTGGKIYGSLFGGGEDGHVLGNSKVNVSETDGTNNPTVIGCSGMTKADGNVFGAGQGTTAEALTAGSVSGNAEVKVSGGKMLGNVYGGGNRGSVGTYLVDAKYEDPGNSGSMLDNPYYGKLREDDGSKTYGYTTVTISGGRIGNDIDAPTQANPTAVGGNVYGGGRGIYKAGNGSVPGPIWPSAARVKQTEVTIKNTAEIKSSVYGGGQIGTVRNNATVNIEGGTVGQNYGTVESPYHFGSVYGGGQGLENLSTDNDSLKPAVYLAGRVYGNSTVNLSGGQVYENVFGGGEIASVGWVKDGTLVNGVSSVIMTGGQVGPLDMTGLNGYVYGGPEGGAQGIGYRSYANSNTSSVEVDMPQDDGSHANRVWGSLFGGGSEGHVLGDASVTLTDGVIGTSGQTSWDGNIFGGGRNFAGTTVTAGRVGGNIDVTMKGGQIYGSIFGGGRQGITGVDEDGNPIDDAHGNITVAVNGGIVGVEGVSNATVGHVFGGGKGTSRIDESGVDFYKRFGEVRTANVTINGSSTLVRGSVYGGSEDGRVLGNTTVTINNGTIGSGANEWQGNVFGGGRGVNTDNGVYDAQNGRVGGQSRVHVNNGDIKNNVFAGGDMGVVASDRIANINGGTVEGDAFGGSNTILVTDADHGKLKTINVRGGHIMGSVYGSSYNATEGTAPAPNTWASGDTYWSSFVNITGGTIDQDVYGAGYGGVVNGSNCVLIGLTAIKNAPTYQNLLAGSPVQVNTYYNDGLSGSPTPVRLKILGNVYDGSDHYGSGTGSAWNTYDISGYSQTFLDGEGYDTEHDEAHATKPYMNIAGGLYGCGTKCESGRMGREILIRNYGTRKLIGGDGTDKDDMDDATRTITTIQRGGIVLMDNSNIHLSGEADISGRYPSRTFGVLQVDNGFHMANGSSIVLGSALEPTYMDSIYELRSVYLKDPASYTTYEYLDGSDAVHYGMVGIKDKEAPYKLYRSHLGASATAFDPEEENVIIFNGDSRVWVRYYNNTNSKVEYGELCGFFRMRSSFSPQGMESFAYARPKLTENNNHISPYTAGNTWNKGDGGFLSYNNSFNDFITTPLTVLGFTYPIDGDDGGSVFTNTRQYPYFNIGTFSKTDNYTNMEMYREWVLPKVEGSYWYVDGRGLGSGGWGKDETHKDHWGDYPDMPKLSVTGTLGICNDPDPSQTRPKFDPSQDIIFVVGSIDSEHETTNLNKSMLEENPSDRYPLYLYRYPGGHRMSNGKKDVTTTSNTVPALPTSSYTGLVNELSMDQSHGPGANLGEIIQVKKNTGLVMDNVIVEGLYQYNAVDSAEYSIPDSYATEKLNVSKPMVVTENESTLTLKGGTILEGGYNNIDVSYNFGTAETPYYNYYPNVDFDNRVLNGGALFVSENATVNVEGKVTITDNLQKKGSGTMASNVYLPTFMKSLIISNDLDPETRIGVTSPIRNREKTYLDNTFSPIAKASTSTIARNAWTHNNFQDDMNCFFVRGNSASTPRTTYYYGDPGKGDVLNTELYFGWT